MSSNPAEIADRVVESFRERLATDSSDAIDEHHFQALHAMVREAIAEHADALVERVALDLQKTRAEMVERRPLEL